MISVGTHIFTLIFWTPVICRDWYTVWQEDIGRSMNKIEEKWVSAYQRRCKNRERNCRNTLHGKSRRVREEKCKDMEVQGRGKRRRPKLRRLVGLLIRRNLREMWHSWEEGEGRGRSKLRWADCWSREAYERCGFLEMRRREREERQYWGAYVVFLFLQLPHHSPTAPFLYPLCPYSFTLQLFLRFLLPFISLHPCPYASHFPSSPLYTAVPFRLSFLIYS